MEIDSCVENFISLYGHGYGRSVMQGSIRYTLGISSGIVSQGRYKGHMDQNEKNCSGIRLHVCGFDRCCSRMICGYASMAVKNPVPIYEYVFRPAILKYGLKNQLRIDHGQEFSLCIFVQDILKNYRQSTEKEPWKQTTSTQNVIERFWPELNSKVNYSQL